MTVNPFAVPGKFKFEPMTTRSGYTLREVAPGMFQDSSGMFRRFFCMDCGEEDPMVFAVKDEIWKEAGMWRGMICWFCLEKRLGRKLRLRDLKKPDPPKHPILANRTIFTCLKISKAIKP